VALDPDIVAWQLRDAIVASSARRLVIDSVAELEEAVAPTRTHDYLAAVVTLLRVEGVTTVLARETFGMFDETPTFVDEPAAVLTENVIFLRQLRLRGELRRLLTVVRMRFSQHDRAIREFTITERGLTMLGRWPSEANMLEGLNDEPARGASRPAGEPS
jgi:circadian clock protein KaiC